MAVKYPVNYCVHVFEVKEFFNKQLAKLPGLTWYYLVSELLVADSFTMMLLLGLALFYTLGVFV